MILEHQLKDLPLPGLGKLTRIRICCYKRHGTIHSVVVAGDVMTVEIDLVMISDVDRVGMAVMDMGILCQQPWSVWVWMTRYSVTSPLPCCTQGS
jgi:hypothetical protein